MRSGTGADWPAPGTSRGGCLWTDARRVSAWGRAGGEGLATGTTAAVVGWAAGGAGLLAAGLAVTSALPVLLGTGRGLVRPTMGRLATPCLLYACTCFVGGGWRRWTAMQAGARLWHMSGGSTVRLPGAF